MPLHKTATRGKGRCRTTGNMCFWQSMRCWIKTTRKLNAKSDAKLRDGERLQKLAEQFSLTPREAEVIGLLVHTDDGLQVIADRLYVSRRTLERYVSAIYEKTGTKSRIGLVSLYNSL